MSGARTIMIINPNTTAAMTDDVVSVANSVAATGTTIIGATPSHGVSAVESNVDEVWAAVGVLDQIAQGERSGIDGYVIACFGDTGVAAARELAEGPVVGMTEAALCTAALLGARFTIVTMPSRTREQSVRVVQSLGLTHRCTVRAIDVPVSDVVGGSMHLLDTFVAEASAAIVEDSSEVIILGCAGLSELVEPMSKVLGVPVIDGVTAAVVILEGLLAQGLRTSRANTFAAPPRVAASGPDLS